MVLFGTAHQFGSLKDNILRFRPRKGDNRSHTIVVYLQDNNTYEALTNSYIFTLTVLPELSLPDSVNSTDNSSKVNST